MSQYIDVQKLSPCIKSFKRNLFSEATYCMCMNLNCLLM